MAIRVTRARSALATVGGVAGNLSHAVAALGGTMLGGHRPRRRVASALVAGLGWRALPVVGAGLALWGLRSWMKRRHPVAEAGGKQLPDRDPKPPQDPVDESSWESFPASDPPAMSPTNRPVRPAV